MGTEALNEYLQFSKNRSSEKGEKFDLAKLLENTIKKYNNKNILNYGQIFLKKRIII